MLMLTLDGIALRVPITPDDTLYVREGSTPRECYVQFDGQNAKQYAGTVVPLVEDINIPTKAFKAKAMSSGNGHQIKLIVPKKARKQRVCKECQQPLTVKGLTGVWFTMNYHLACVPI